MEIKEVSQRKLDLGFVNLLISNSENTKNGNSCDDCDGCVDCIDCVCDTGPCDCDI